MYHKNIFEQDKFLFQGAGERADRRKGEMQSVSRRIPTTMGSAKSILQFLTLMTNDQ